jgi:hypothetical protein
MTPEQLITKHREPIDHAGTDAISEVQLLADIAHIGLCAAEFLSSMQATIYLEEMQQSFSNFNRKGD